MFKAHISIHKPIWFFRVEQKILEESNAKGSHGSILIFTGSQVRTSFWSSAAVVTFSLMLDGSGKL